MTQEHEQVNNLEAGPDGSPAAAPAAPATPPRATSSPATPPRATSSPATPPGTPPEITHNPERDPSDWVTGDEPSTGPQESYIRTLAKEAGEEVPTDLTKAEASKTIDQLQAQTGRG